MINIVTWGCGALGAIYGHDRAIFILVSCRVKGHTRFVGMYIAAEGSVSDPIKYIYF